MIFHQQKEKIMKHMNYLWVQGVALTILCGVVLAAEPPLVTQSQQPLEPLVMALRPVGFWPMSEGSGLVIHDRSGNGNHGKWVNVPWENGLVNFTSAFQWGEIPPHVAYQGPAFSMGGWLFNRRPAYRRNGMLFMALANPLDFISNKTSVALRVRTGLEVEVVANGREDAIGSLAEKDVIKINAWQHIFYTYENGTGRLYLNGKLVRTIPGVDHQARKAPVLIGSCADWWMLHPPGANSLDGAVRDMALFDRALTAGEVAQLAAAKPSVRPRVFGSDVIIIDDRQLALTDLSALSGNDLGCAMGELAGRDADAMVRRQVDVLLPTVIKALDVWQARRDATTILMKLNSASAKAALAQARPRLIQTLQDSAAPVKERATCALALAGMKTQAKEAVPALVGVLKGIIQKEGVRVPRVEDLLRNAVLRALLDIDPKDEAVRSLLSQALAQPILEMVDLSRAELGGVRQLVGSGKHLEALDANRALDLKNHGKAFFSQGDGHRDARNSTPNERAYTPIATYGGFTYTLGEGRSFRGVEAATPAVVEKAIQAWAPAYPAAKQWRAPDAPNLCRVKIVKADASGQAQTAYLEGEHFVFDGSDAKVRGWSIAVDTKGFIHIVGGQHNMPNPNYFIPGSWEKMGVPRDRNAGNHPNQLYWVSRNPGDITDFEFVGHKNNPHQIASPGYLNYMNFVQDRRGTLYILGRINVGGWQSWGLYRYDVHSRSWSPIGGDAAEVIASAKKAHPDWGMYLMRNIRGGIPATGGIKSLAWAWQPHFYNYCRSRWGVQFDPDNRMHVHIPIRGLDLNARIIDHDVYAYSDDGGVTFHRADGSKVALPLTTNPAPEHDADVQADGRAMWWTLWLSLLESGGISKQGRLK